MNRFLLIAWLAVPLVSCAFEQARHGSYTQAAGEWVLSCNVAGALSRDDIGSLAEGAMREDDWSFVRMTNWHYAPNARMFPYIFLPAPIVMRTDLREIFAARVNDIADYVQRPQCERAGVFVRAGRALHYIQDMRVPAHVIPISHGFLFGHDEFDGYPFEYPHPPASRCEAWEKWLVGATLQDFHQMLKAAAADTRDRLNHPVEVRGTPQQCTWGEAFWCDGEQEDCGAEFAGFGSYRKSLFGQSAVICGSASITLNPSDYLAFFEKAYGAMFADVAQVALLAGQLADIYCRRPNSAP